MTENEMVGWHHRLNGHEFEQTQGGSGGHCIIRKNPQVPHTARQVACHLMNNLGGSIGEGNGTPLQYSCLENPMDGQAWWAAVHGVVKSRTRLNDFTFTFHFYALEKEMAGKPVMLLFMESQKLRHN